MKSFFNTTKILGVALLTLAFYSVQAQTTILNQQSFSRVNRNPAAAASGTEALNMALFYHAQWVGMNGAPVTVLFNGDTYINKLNSGFGLTMSYDAVGQSRSNFNALLSYGYRFNLTEDWKLSLGLAAGLMNINNDPTKNNFGDNSDPLTPTKKVNAFNPDFNIGAELSFKNLTAGLALDHLLYADAGTFDEPKTPREFYIYGRYNFQLPANFELAPQVAWYYFNAAKTNTFELGAIASYNKLAWLGVDWFAGEAVAFMAGVEFSGFQLGYVYQLSIGDVGQLSRNTHELMLKIKIDYKK